MRKPILIIAGLILACGGVYLLYKVYQGQKYQKETVPAAVEISKVESQSSQQKIASTEQNASAENSTNLNLPPALNLKMTFYAQAPFGNWDYPWQEACEEASILLIANVYYSHNWTTEQFNDQILALVKWENEQFGYYKDTTVKQVVQMLNDYLHLKTVVYENPSYEDVKKVLAKGHLIVMTFAGKELGNPNFRNGGPLYHAMVIKGYKEGGKIITEDVGTRNGEDYVYSWSTLQNALHDYIEPIDNGAKRMIEVLPALEATP